MDGSDNQQKIDVIMQDWETSNQQYREIQTDQRPKIK